MAEELDEKLARAEQLFLEWHLDDALVQYQEILEDQPHSRTAINRIARIHALRGRVKSLIDISSAWQEQLDAEGETALAGMVAQAVLTFDPNSVVGRMGMLHHVMRTSGVEAYIALARNTARYFVEVGSGELSIQILNEAREKFPDDMSIAIDLADMHFAQGNMQDAIKQFKAIAERFERSGECLSAADAYRRLKILLPDSIDITLRLGNIYEENERFEDAISEYRSVLRTDYNNILALSGLATSSLALERYNDAILALRKILTVEPGDSNMREKLAQAYYKTGAMEDCVKEYTTCAQFLLQEKSLPSAIRILEEVIRINPNNAAAVRELSNAKADLKAQEARAAKLSSLAARTKVEAPATPEKASSTKVSDQEDDLLYDSSSEDESLYGDDGEGLLGGGEVLGLGADEGSEELMGGLGAPQAAVATSSSAVVEEQPTVTRVLPVEAIEGKLRVPVPFLTATYPDLIPLIVQEVTEPPEQELTGWKFLEKREQTEAVSQEAAADEQEPVMPSVGTPSAFGSSSGPIRSAFGEGGGFSSAVASRASSGRSRRGSWEFVPYGAPRGRRGSSRDNKQQSLAEKIKGAAEQSSNN